MNFNKPAPSGGIVSREPVSSEVLAFAATLANRAESLAERTQAKLSPVMTSPIPNPVEIIGKDLTEYPPLFSDLRGRFFVISKALDAIEDALSRTEL